jgi:hypothetical protein
MIVNQVKRLPKSRKRNKYNVAPKEKRTENGIVFASQAEMMHYRYLRILMKDKIVQWVFRQVPVDLPGGIRYVADFLVIYTDGHVELHEVKGFETAVWKQKRKLLDIIDRPPLRVIDARDASSWRSSKSVLWRRGAGSVSSNECSSAPTDISHETSRERYVLARWHESSPN